MVVQWLVMTNVLQKSESLKITPTHASYTTVQKKSRQRTKRWAGSIHHCARTARRVTTFVDSAVESKVVPHQIDVSIGQVCQIVSLGSSMKPKPDLQHSKTLRLGAKLLQHALNKIASLKKISVFRNISRRWITLAKSQPQPVHHQATPLPERTVGGCLPPPERTVGKWSDES